MRDRNLKVNITVKDGITFAIGDVTPGDVGTTSGIKRKLCVFVTPHITKHKDIKSEIKGNNI